MKGNETSEFITKVINIVKIKIIKILNIINSTCIKT